MSKNKDSWLLDELMKFGLAYHKAQPSAVGAIKEGRKAEQQILQAIKEKAPKLNGTVKVDYANGYHDGVKDFLESLGIKER